MNVPTLYPTGFDIYNHLLRSEQLQTPSNILEGYDALFEGASTRARAIVSLISPRTLVIIAASIATTVWYATVRGQDLNWDQKNYHIGVPFLLAHNNFWQSIAPAGIQSYFNPYVLELEYFGLAHLNPIAFSIVVAIVQSTAFMIAGFVCVEMVNSIRIRASAAEKTFLSLLGFALCLMTPVVLSEAGTTFIDFLCAVPVVGAYALLLCRHRFGLIPATASAGVLLGLATALKLTDGVFALGAIGFAFAGSEQPRQRAQLAAVLIATGLLGFLVVGSSWLLAIWQRFQNPFFPYYNSIFHSPDFGSDTLRDARWLPHSVLDIWRYPVSWVFTTHPVNDQAMYSSELFFVDMRWAVLITGGTLFIAVLFLCRGWRQQMLKEPTTGFMFAIIIAYLIWLAEFGYQRYLAPIDILCGAGVLFLILQIPWQLERIIALIVVSAISFGVMKVPDWGHLPWKSRWQTIDPKPVEFGHPAIVFLSDKPMSYIVASFQSDVRYVGISGDFDINAGNNTALSRQLKQELAETPKAILKEVDRGSLPAPASAMLASYGLSNSNKCQPFKIADDVFRICDVERSAP